MPERKFKITTIKLMCLDCGTEMKREKNPIMKALDNHIVSKCPTCGMELANYNNTYIIMGEGRPKLGIKWDLAMEEKKKVLAELQKEKEMREQLKKEEIEFNRQLEQEYKKEMEAGKKEK